MAKPTWIEVIEATYDVDSSVQTWLAGVARASHPVLGDGFGVFAFGYDASTPESLKIDCFAGTPDSPLNAQSALAGIQAAGGGRYVRDTFCSLQTEAVRSTPGFAGTDAERMFDASGVGDLVVINGVDPSGIGTCMGALTSARVRLSRAQRQRYARVAAHLANAYRLRRRLAAPASASAAPWGADAVLSAAGRLDHCSGDEVHQARERLRTAAVAIDRARGRLRRIEPDSALAEWEGLVDGRWSLVDKFDTDGKRFVLARRNEPRVTALERLTERERAVVAYAALGHSNKLIAYDLGIAHSTVRVLLARAAQRLGVRSREEVVAAFRGSASPAPPSSSAHGST